MSGTAPREGKDTMFQQRHFEALALLMQELHPGAGLPLDNRAAIQWDATHIAMARLFAQGNPRFDRGRFLRACEPGANVRARTVKTFQRERDARKLSKLVSGLR